MAFLHLSTKAVMPLILVLFAGIMLFSKKNLVDSFVLGVNEGLECCKRILPTLLLIMCAVSAMFSSGAVEVMCVLFKPFLSLLGVDDMLLPTIVLRPFSGSGVTAIADKLFENAGPDSSVSKTASLLMGSTDTIIYTLSMYFSAVKIKKTRYALPASFVVFVFSIFVCAYVGRIML